MVKSRIWLRVLLGIVFSIPNHKLQHGRAQAKSVNNKLADCKVHFMILFHLLRQAAIRTNNRRVINAKEPLDHKLGELATSDQIGLNLVTKQK